MSSRLVLSVALLLLPAGACTNRPSLNSGLGAYRVSFVGQPDLGTEQKPLPFAVFDEKGEFKDMRFTINIEGLIYRDGGWVVDEGYDGFAVVTVQPAGKLIDDPVDVHLVRGRASKQVGVRMAFGQVRLVVSDPGFIPAVDPRFALCASNDLDEYGRPRYNDEDGDGFADHPKDRGCYNPGDDSEDGGSGAVGVSPVINFDNPRIADIQRPGKEADKSALKDTRVTVDEGFMLVSRVSTDGLYVTDFDGALWQASSNSWLLNATDMFYRSIFAFNFSTPLNIVEGDCLVQLDGTVEEFYNYTELGKPTWKKGDYPFCAALAQRAGLACDPKTTDEGKINRCREQLENLSNTPFELTKLMVEQPGGGEPRSIWDHVGVQAERFESALVQVSDVEMFTEVRRCDRNGNNVVDFGIKEEADCSNDCGDDPGCVIAETYDRYKQWTVHFLDGNDPPVMRKVSVVTQGAIPKFDPMAAFKAYEGKTPKRIGKLVGTMRHLGFGRPPWTLEPRRPSDCSDCTN